ncbi:hypothetical protein NIES2119_12060 [[Phormidium ambiguum] IAM M-71]|uniref:Uncharacterized protein n=1 Tax=[Phormidium ambiguum] IAM M-71 TaxID=454136 RepID=A0A1U7IKX7_9CYAN|nr:hypothetical protein [Phormidium ambiguum]OKH37877.1 hypothetical protein NIES2119_12060 [Phormidium ambiguum IAM M-71]
MPKKMQFLMGFATFLTIANLALLPESIAQNSQSNFAGRGVASGSIFNRGRNANVSLTTNRDNFGFEMAETSGNRGRIQYRGSIIRRSNSSNNSRSFTLDGRVQTFTSSTNLRPINNTTGTCQIEVFDSRVISSTCRTVSSDSTTRFMGLEQF